MYNWEHADWPHFRFLIDDRMDEKIYQFIEVAGKTDGLLQGLPQDIRTEAMINLMVTEAIKTSEIEGEYLSRQDVLSSIKKNLGIHTSKSLIKDKRAEGMANLMVAVRNTFSSELTESQFYDQIDSLLNERHRKVLNRMFREGPDGFTGGMSAKKYTSIAKTSKSTATRDLKFLVSIGAMVPLGEGRSRKYRINLGFEDR